MALKLLFAGTTAAQGSELWMLDVATGQSSMVMDVRPGTASGFYNVAITDLGNGTALFGARASGSSSPELWVTNGASWGTRPLLDATAPSQAVFPRDVMMTSSGDVLFVAKTGAIQDLWVTDGTSAHTSKLGLNTNGLSSSFWDFTGLADGRVLFTSDVGNDASTRDQWNIWITDGTRAGTVEAGGNAWGNYNTFAALGDGRVIFSGYSDKGEEPWISDGTPTGTSLLKDVAQGYRWSSPAIPFSLPDGRVMFVVRGNGAGADVNELWVTGGTAGNTSLFLNLAAAPSRLRYVSTYTSYTPAYDFMPLANNKVVFVGDDYDQRYPVAYYPNRGNGRELWSLDLTTKAVTQLTNTPGQASSLWDRNTNLDRTYRLDAGHMLFIGKDASHGQELWITDGTVAGTHIVKDIAPGTATGGARSFLRLPDGRLVFTAPDATLGNTGIWTTDGTEGGTRLLFSVAGTTAIGTLALADLNPVLPDTTTSVGDPDLLTDTGSSTSDNLTATPMPVFSGTAEAGATVLLLEGTVELGSAVATGGNWTVTSTALSAGLHGITARARDAAGNTAISVALPVTIDTATAVSVVDLLSDTGLSGSDDLTAASPAIVAGTAEPGATVVLLDGTVALGSMVAATGGAWSLTAALADGVHMLHATALDAAGNTAASAELPVTIDTATAVSAVDLLRDTGLSGSDDLTAANPAIVAGTAEAGATVVLLDGTTTLGSVVATGGAWSVTAALADGVHTLHATALDAAGNTAASPELPVTIDTATAVSAVDLLSDTGMSGSDDLTAAAAAILAGTAEAGATVVLYEGSAALVSTVASGGTWSVTTTPLGDGLHRLHAAALDAAGNTAVSPVLPLTIDTATAVGSPGLAAATDSSIVGDNRTSFPTPLISGTAEAFSTVLLREAGSSIGQAIADATGAWSIGSVSLAYGTHGLVAEAVDAAGNTAMAAPWLLTIEPLAAPVLLGLADMSDTGVAGDNMTTDTTPTLGGSAIAGQVVMLHDGARLLGSVAAAADGSWSITAPELGGGNAVVHSLWAVACDGTGAMSVTSTRLVTVDTVVPDAPVGLALAGQQGGQRDLQRYSGAVTTDRTPVLQGTAEAGMTVTLFEGGSGLGSALVDDLGHWRVASRDLGGVAGAVHRIDAVVTDAVGHVSPASAVLTITMASVLPVPGDLDGNGGADLLLWHGGSGALRAWMMDGASLTDALDLGPAAGAPLPVLRGQVDFGVGAALVLHQGNDPLTGWSMASLDRGAGSIMLPPAGSLAGLGTDWPAAGSLVAQGMADLDGDDMPELIMRQGGTGALSSWRIGADGSLGGPQDLGNPGAQWQVLGVGEFDGDGLGDLLFEGPGGYLWIWRMQGAAVQHQGGLEGPGPGWALAAIGDSNGDARSDLLWRNSADGRLLLWDMDAGGRIAAHDRGVLADAAVIRLRDLDHDGSADLIWQDSGGAIHLSLSPDQPLSTAAVLQAAPGWTLI